MQIYKAGELYNRYVQDTASDAFEDQLLSTGSFIKIKEAHPDSLYTPNFFIRLALTLLTAVAVLFSAALFALASWSSESSILTGLVFLAIVSYLALELFVQKRKLYNAGVDNTLMVAIPAFIAGAFFVNDFGQDNRLLCAVMGLVCGFLCLRFTDALMAVLCYVAFSIFLFINFIQFGSMAKMLSPFFMMIISGAVFQAAGRLRTAKIFHSYHFCSTAISLAALLSFYASGNYFIVNELSIEMFGEPLTRSGWMAGVFWFFTVAIPLLYVALGIVRKDRLLIRTGLLLIAAAVFTVRYYHALFPLEITLLIAGMLLVAASYVLVRYLRAPKHGFVFKIKKADASILEKGESLVTADRFGAAGPAVTGFEFGGGSGSGAGASGKF